MSFPRYPKYKYSGIEWFGDIPEHWSMTRLGWICSNIDDVNHEMPAAVYEGVPFLSAKDLLDDGTLNFTSDVKQISEVDFERLSKKIRPQRDDIIYSRIGTLGKARLVETDQRFLISYSCCVVRVSEEAVCKKFVCHLLDGEMLLTEARMRTKGIGVPDLGLGEISRFPIPLPPREEQTRIASFLDRETAKIDALVAEQQRLIELLKEKRQAVISHAVTKGLNPNVRMKDSGIEWLGDVPEHWEVTPIGHLCDSITYGFTNPMPTTDEGPFLLTANDVDYGNVKYETARRTSYEAFQNDLTEKSRPKKDDVLITKDGTLGRVALHDGQEACINQSVASLRVNPNSMLPQFMATCLLGGIYQGRMIYDAGGTTIKHIYISRLAKMPIAYPSPSEQDEVHAFLREELAKLDSLTAEAQRAIDLLQERRTALISAAVTGKIDVRDFANLGNLESQR